MSSDGSNGSDDGQKLIVTIGWPERVVARSLRAIAATGSQVAKNNRQGGDS